MNRQELATYVGDLISKDRNETHGDPHAQFGLQVDMLKLIMSQWRGPISNTAYHAIEQITTKLSRLAVGVDLQDSWLDIAGYALIAAEIAKTTLTEQVPAND